MKNLFFVALISLLFSHLVLAQAHLVKDINTTIDADVSGGKDFFRKSGNLAYFSKRDEKGVEGWRTDGTKEGTFRITDIVKGFNSSVSTFTRFADLDGELLFNNSGELWKTDGTVEGTRRITKMSFDGQSVSINQIAVIENKAIIFVTTATGQSHVFLYSKGNETVSYIKQIGINLNTVTALSGQQRVYFGMRNVSNAYEFWVSDGTANGTRKVTSLSNKGDFSQMVEAGDVVVASVGTQKLVVANVVTDNPINEITLPSGEFVTGGLYATGSSVLVGTDKNVLVVNSVGNVNTAISNVRAIDVAFDTNELYVLGFDRINNNVNLYHTDEDVVLQGSVVALGNTASSPNQKRQAAVLGDKIFTVSWTSQSGPELTLIENTTVNVIKDINPGSAGSDPQSFMTLNGRVLFVADPPDRPLEIWVTDGTETGTHSLLDPQTRTADGLDNRNFFIFGNQAWFYGWDPQGPNLWHSTSDGTNALKDQVLSGGFPIGVLNNEFYAHVNGTGFTKSDGNGNVSVVQARAETASSNVHPNDVIQIGNKLIFPMTTSVDGVQLGYELWVTDGTDAGTHIVKDIFPGINSGIQNTTSTGRTAKLNENTFMFMGGESVNGLELWKSNGTGDGTILVKDLEPGAGSSNTSNFTNFKNKIFFVFGNGLNGAKVWMTDGTPEGTVILEGQDPNLNVNGNLRVVGEYLLFTAELDGWGVYRTDGVSPAQKVKQLDTSGDADLVPANSLALGNKMYFNYPDGQGNRALWMSDGTAEGTKFVESPSGSTYSNPRPVGVAEGQLYIALNEQLYRIAGPKPLVEKMSDLEPIVLAKAGNRVYFKVLSGDYGIEMFSMPILTIQQSIDFTVADRKISEGDFQLSAEVNSGLAVVYSSTSPAITIDGSNVDVKSPGKVTIKATQPGDNSFESATASATFCIAPDKPQISVSGSTVSSSAAIGNQWFFNGTPIPSASSSTYQTSQSGLYSVQVNIDGCTSEISANVNVTTTGLEDKFSTLSIYPNPATEEVNIFWANGQSVELTMQSAQGIILEKRAFQETFKLNVAERSNGVYILTLRSGGDVVTQKFIKH